MLCHKRYLRWALNGGCILTVTLILTLCLLNLINQRLPVLRCLGSDIIEPNLSHKINGDTVSAVTLGLVSIFFPYAQIVLTELFVNRPAIIARSSSNYYGSKEDSFQKHWKKSLSFYSRRWFSDYIFGLIFTTLIVDVVKTTMNAPRPHFLDSCKPSFGKDACRNGWLDAYECTNTELSRWRLVDSHKSFPSGHAAIGMFTAFYMIFYQHSALHLRNVSKIVLITLHTAWLSWAVICASSRVVDFRHHPIDVLFGGLIGAFAAIVIVFILSDCFKNWKPHSGTSANNGDSKSQHLVLDSGDGATVRRSVGGVGGAATATATSELGSINSTKAPNTSSNGDVRRQSSLRRLLSAQSTMTTMSDISEDEGNENFKV